MSWGITLAVGHLRLGHPQPQRYLLNYNLSPTLKTGSKKDLSGLVYAQLMLTALTILAYKK